MRLNHWMNRFVTRLNVSKSSRQPMRRRSRRAEHLEDRTLLTTAAILINNTELTILADEGDHVAIDVDPITLNVDVRNLAVQISESIDPVTGIKTSVLLPTWRITGLAAGDETT